MEPLIRRLKQAAYDCANYADGAPDSSTLAKACTVWEQDFQDAVDELEDLKQRLYEAQNPMLPNGETITVDALYALWQKAERERDALREALRLARSWLKEWHGLLDHCGSMNATHIMRLEGVTKMIARIDTLDAAKGNERFDAAQNNLRKE